MSKDRISPERLKEISDQMYKELHRGEMSHIWYNGIEMTPSQFQEEIKKTIRKPKREE